jgi:hypothetical protein
MDDAGAGILQRVICFFHIFLLLHTDFHSSTFPPVFALHNAIENGDLRSVRSAIEEVSCCLGHTIMFPHLHIPVL